MPRLLLEINAAASEDQLATVSTEFPRLDFRILARHTVDDHLLGIVHVRTTDGDSLVRHFDAAVGVHSSEVIHADSDAVLLQYRIPIPDSYRAARASGNLSLFPILMRNGWLSVERSASHERLAWYVDELRDAGLQYEILSVMRSHDPVELLTDRQRQLLTEAVACGYYETPRRCTLTELAEMLDVNKSAAIGILRRAEGRIIEDALAERLF